MTELGVKAGAHSALLPCVEANLEALLGFAGVDDVLTVLGAPCTIEVTGSGLPRLWPVQISEWINRCTGLELVREQTEDVLGAIGTRVTNGIPCLIHADAFTVPWNPYAGHEHHQHAFVADGWDGGRLHVVDSYTNATRYGKAEPTQLWVDAAEITGTLRPHQGASFTVEHLSGTAHEPDVAHLAPDIIARNIGDHRAARDAGRDADALAAMAAEPDGETLAALSLAIWLLFRLRNLHSLWWQRLPAAEPVLAGLATVTAQWQSAQTISYLAWRRVEAGHPCPPTLPEAMAKVADSESQCYRSMQAWLDGGHL